MLVDLEALSVIPKEYPPRETLLPLESHNVWREVTAAIKAKEFSKATKAKQNIEERQRKEARIRRECNEEYWPKYFRVVDKNGRAVLTREGKMLLDPEIRTELQT